MRGVVSTEAEIRYWARGYCNHLLPVEDLMQEGRIAAHFGKSIRTPMQHARRRQERIIYVPINRAERGEIPVTAYCFSQFDNDIANSYDWTEQADNRLFIEQLLSVLTRGQRRALMLLYADGYSRKDAAEIMGVSPYTVAGYRDAAMKRLRRLFPDLFRDEWD